MIFIEGRPRLFHKLVLYGMAGVVAAGAILTAGFYQYTRRMVLSELRLRGDVLVESIGHGAQRGLETRNVFHTLEPLVRSAAKHADIAYVQISDAQGLVLASAGSLPRPGGALEMSLPIYSDAEMLDTRGAHGLGAAARRIGSVRLDISTAALHRRMRQALVVAVLLLGSLMLAGTATAWLFARRLTLPIQEMAKAAARIGAGQYGAAVAVQSRDELGQLAGTFNKMCQDLLQATSESNRADEALRQSEVKYRTLFEASADGILITDDQTRMFRYANPAICRMLGYAEEELRMLGVADIHPKDALPEIAAALKAQARGEKSFTSELPCRRKDGTTFYADIRAARLPIDGRMCHVAMFRDITERKQAEEQIERLSRFPLENPNPVLRVSAQGILDYANAASDAVLLTMGAKVGGAVNAEWQARIGETFAKDHPVNVELQVGDRTFSATLKPVVAHGYVNLYAHDITKRKQALAERERLQAQLMQSQKMESVGRLAGGVAHDFNNLLTAIKGYGEFVRDALPAEDPKRADVVEILSAADRAAALTRQLLAFSRRQILSPRVVDINRIVGDMTNMLKRLLGEDIKLETKLAGQPCMATVDPGQTGQVIMNLVVNARDAMSNGGTITLETEIMTLGEDFFTARPDLRRGPLVRLSVRDTGCGMSDEVKSHLFEPFYTTKEKGKGTGLGLATVIGIIKQSGGEIEVESAPNSGTTFRIYFPQMEAAAREKDEEKEKEKEKPDRGHETVLLVDDDATIRRLGERALVANGYTVLTAADGREALKMLTHHAKPVDLLVTDVMMPGMNGRDLAQEVARRNMARRTLFISGYAEPAMSRHEVVEPGLAFLHKPFSPEALLRKLREVLDGPAEQAKI